MRTWNTNYSNSLSMEAFIKRFTGISLIAALLLTAACGGGSEQESAESEQTSSDQMEVVEPAEATEKLNLNTASEEEFGTIPGVGEQMIHEFEEYRPYVSIRQFRREIGKYVDSTQVAEYEKYLFVPIDWNESDAATLQQIPGLDATEADSLISGRPYESREAFLQALGEYISEEQLAAAEHFLPSQ